MPNLAAPSRVQFKVCSALQTNRIFAGGDTLPAQV